MTIAQKVHAGLLAMAAVAVLTAWGIGLMSGDLASLDRDAASVLFLVELPFLTFWLVPGSVTARFGVLLSVLVASDAARVHVLAASETMILAEAWPWLAVLAGGWLLNQARRRVTRATPDRAPDYGPAPALPVIRSP